MRRFTVKSLNEDLDATLTSRYDTILVEGEVRDLKTPSSGHCYIALTDQGSALSAVVWRNVWMATSYRPKIGDRVVCRGRLRVYVTRGVYQLYVHEIQPAGLGALAKEIAERKARLLADGLLDPSRKRRLPPFPNVVGVVTSLTGAALQDFLKVSGHRYPSCKILVAGSVVQGAMAPSSLIRALELLIEEGSSEVIVLTRGGGAKEDLLAFQDEMLARAIAASPIPVVSAVGHQIDTTIADLVADCVAPTPSAAALLVFPDGPAYMQRVDEEMFALSGAIVRWLRRQRIQLGHIRARLRHPGQRLKEIANTREDLLRRLEEAALRGIVKQRRSYLAHLKQRLWSLSPEQVLSRGYAIVRKEDQLMTDASDVDPGDTLVVQFRDGRISATVPSN
jgi:exodeoxyribonuclease VII large subunit